MFALLIVLVFGLFGTIYVVTQRYDRTDTALSSMATTSVVTFFPNHNDHAGTERLFDRLVLLGADRASLRYMSEDGSIQNYAKDKNSVYWLFVKPRKIVDADPDTFAVWQGTNEIIAHDKNHVYLTGHLVPDADPSTFHQLQSSNGYYFDANHVFYSDIVDTQTDYDYRLRMLIGADPKTIQLVTINSILVKDDNYVYLNGKVVQGIKGKEFRSVTSEYFIDADTTYYFAVGPEAKIQFLASTSQIKVLAWGAYALIGKKVYMGTTTISGANASRFKVYDAEDHNDKNPRAPCVGSCPYASDEERVYYAGNTIALADPKTFELLGYGLLYMQGKDPSNAQPAYARDVSRVYYQGQVVIGANPKNFVPLVSGGYFYEYGKDDTHVYWKNVLIDGADPKTFHVVGEQQPYEGCAAGRYGTDTTAVYFEAKKIENADPLTFKVIIGAGTYGEDKDRFYVGSTPADRKEFKVCNYG